MPEAPLAEIGATPRNNEMLKVSLSDITSRPSKHKVRMRRKKRTSLIFLIATFIHYETVPCIKSAGTFVTVATTTK